MPRFRSGTRLHGASAWRLVGAQSFITALTNRFTGGRLDEALKAAAREVLEQAVRNAPRETGLLESEIKIRKLGDKEVGVGVDPSSPAYKRGLGTEFGSWNYSVGDAESPKRSWPNKTKMGATMPWLRPAVLEKRKDAYAAMRRLLFD